MTDCPSSSPFLHYAPRRVITVVCLLAAVWLAGCAQMGGSGNATTATATTSASVAQTQPPVVPANVNRLTDVDVIMQAPFYKEFYCPDTKTSKLDTLQVDRLTDLVARALPVDLVMQIPLNENLNFPFGKKASRLDKSQLQCVRTRLSSAGFRENRKQAVEEFMKCNPAQVQDAIDVLGQGTVDFIGYLFRVGLEQLIPAQNQNPDPESDEINSAINNLTSEQKMNVIAFYGENKHQYLRRLVFFGFNSFDNSVEKKKYLAKNIFLKTVAEALDHCQVPLSALQ